MKKDVYEEPIIIKRDGFIARVYKPIISDEERKIRMKRIEESAAKLLLSVEKGKQKDLGK